MNRPPTHILAPVELHEALPLGPRLAMQLASGADSLVTLLYVDPRPTTLTPRDQLDAISLLHQVTTLVPRASTCAPAYPEKPRAPVLKRLKAYRDELQATFRSDAEVRVAWRQGDVLEETLAFVEEAGVDVVVIDAPAPRASAAMRRLQYELLQRRPCHVLTAHSPRAAAAANTLPSSTRWRRLVQWWRHALARTLRHGRRAPGRPPRAKSPEGLAR